MNNDPQLPRDDKLPWARAAAMNFEAEDVGGFAGAGWWLTGSASLLLWTAIALVLTSA